MRKITTFEEEWSGLGRLAFASMRLIFALEELGEEVVRALIRDGLVSEEAGRLAVTEVGLRVLKANPHPFVSGIRVWIDPSANTFAGGEISFPELE